MSQMAKLFTTGRSQAVRLPKAFRLSGSEVFIRRDEATGDIILSPKKHSWDDFFVLADKTPLPEDFMGAADRASDTHITDPFSGFDK